jgi:hypothetical protein
VRYRDPNPHSSYPEFLGTGVIIRIDRESWSQRPVYVEFRDCADGEVRRRTFSPSRLEKVKARDLSIRGSV